MIVVIDTNILRADFSLARPSTRVLFEFAEMGGYRLCVPKVVRDEICNLFAEEVDRAFKATRRAVGGLRRLLEPLPALQASGLWGFIDSTAYRSALGDSRQHGPEQFLAALDAALGTNTVALDTYPTVSHQEVVARALARRRPFDPTGENGYRDTVLWESILELLAETREEIVLLTGDKGFAGEADDLHDHLKQDLIDRGVAPDRVSVISGADRFVAEHVVGKLSLGTLADVGLDATQIALLEVRIRRTLEEFLESGLYGDTLEPENLGVRPEYETIHVSIIENVSGLVVDEVYQVTPAEVLLRANARALGYFDVFIYKADFWPMEPQVGLHIQDADWNDHYVLAGLELPLDVRFDAIADISSLEVISIEVEDIVAQQQWPESFD